MIIEELGTQNQLDEKFFKAVMVFQKSAKFYCYKGKWTIILANGRPAIRSYTSNDRGWDVLVNTILKARMSSNKARLKSNQKPIYENYVCILGGNYA